MTLLTDGPGDGVCAVDTPAAHEGDAAAQTLDPLSLVLDTGGVEEGGVEEGKRGREGGGGAGEGREREGRRGERGRGGGGRGG